MSPRTDINECRRLVAYDVAKSIQNSRVTSVNMTHLTKISAVNCKQLSNDITDPVFLWYLWVSSVKVGPQWAKYPNPCIRSFVRSKKLILEFNFVTKKVKYRGHLFGCTHNSLSLRLPLGCAHNLLVPHLPGLQQGRLDYENVLLDRSKQVKHIFSMFLLLGKLV
jgi:hypothetical protein